MKYLVLVIQLKKQTITLKLQKSKKKLTNHNHDKYIDTSEFNKLAVHVFNARITQANLITKTDFDAKLSSLNRKITKKKSKHLLVQNELTTLENKILMLAVLLKKQIITLKLLKLILRYQTLMVKLRKIYQILQQ